MDGPPPFSVSVCIHIYIYIYVCVCIYIYIYIMYFYAYLADGFLYISYRTLSVFVGALYQAIQDAMNEVLIQPAHHRMAK